LNAKFVFVGCRVSVMRVLCWLRGWWSYRVVGADREVERARGECCLSWSLG
jgi:hypothetical protein